MIPAYEIEAKCTAVEFPIWKCHAKDTAYTSCHHDDKGPIREITSGNVVLVSLCTPIHVIACQIQH